MKTTFDYECFKPFKILTKAAFMKTISNYSLFVLFALLLACGDTLVEPTLQITISLNNFTTSIDENAVVGTAIGTVSGSTNEGNLSYTLSEQNPSGALAIDAVSGEITVADASAFDFETNQKITATVTARNGGISEDASVTITINNLDESAPKTIWTGDIVSFSKTAGSDPNEEANQDRITENVWITRGNDGGQIYNVKSESSSDKASSPEDTEWAIGNIEDIEKLTFKPFRDALGGKPKNEVGTDLVMHLISENIYLSLKITAWSNEKNGAFTYDRSSE